MKTLTARMEKAGPRRRATLLSMGTSTPSRPQLSPSGLQLFEQGSGHAYPVVGMHHAWRKLLLQAEMVAPHLQVAAIEGEAGTGKQTLARYLHARSPLAKSAFQRHDARQWLLIDLDPATLEGFVYLDRVDLLSLPGQGLLLTVVKALQDRLPGRAALMASSQASLQQMATQGVLMPDLAFRLTAVRFAVPPLRQRMEDIPPLAQALLDRICTRYNQRTPSLGPGVLTRLLQHTWPGNVRELSSTIEAALLDAEYGVILTENLPIPSCIDIRPDPQTAVRTESLILDDVIHRHLQYVLDLNRGNKLRAARQLGISRSTLYRILANNKGS
jgi:DNA-binding NtrC family response regulator